MDLYLDSVARTEQSGLAASSIAIGTPTIRGDRLWGERGRVGSGTEESFSLVLLAGERVVISAYAARKQIYTLINATTIYLETELNLVTSGPAGPYPGRFKRSRYVKPAASPPYSTVNADRATNGAWIVTADLAGTYTFTLAATCYSGTSESKSVVQTSGTTLSVAYMRECR